MRLRRLSHLLAYGDRSESEGIEVDRRSNASVSACDPICASNLTAYCSDNFQEET